LQVKGRGDDAIKSCAKNNLKAPDLFCSGRLTYYIYILLCFKKREVIMVWYKHSQGNVKGLFMPFLFKNTVCLLLKNGGALYRPRDWLKVEHKHLKIVEKAQ